MAPEEPSEAAPVEASRAPPPGGLDRAVRRCRRALRRRWPQSLAALAATVGLAAAGLLVLPQTWHVEAVLLAERLATMSALGNPERTIPREADAPTRTARDQVLDRENLRAIILELDLPRQARLVRSPPERLADGLRRRVAGPRSLEEEVRAVEDLLLERLYITTGQDETVAIGFTWRDPEVARRVVELAVRRFLERRSAIETLPITEAIAILEQHAAEAGRLVEDARAELVRREAGLGEGRPARRAERASLAPGQLGLAATRSLPPADEPRGSDRVVEDRWEMARAGELRPPGEAEDRSGTDGLRRPPRGSRLVDPELAQARRRLRAAAGDRERLERRLDNARIELDVARAVVAHRYTVLRPPDPRRQPARPRPAVVLLGGLLCGLALAAFVALAGEVAGPDGRAALPAARRRWHVPATAGAIAVTTVGLLVAFDSPAVALAPALLAILAWAAWRAPLRHSALALLLLMLALEAPGDASGRWQAPWALLGHLLNTNLNLTLPIPWLRFAGVDLLVAALLLLMAWRRATGVSVDGPWPAPMPRPLRVAMLVSLGTTSLLIAYGLARGGLFSQVLWQVHVMAMVPVMALVFHAVLRWPADFVTLGKLVVAAAVIKAAQAGYVRFALGFSKEQVPTATSHADSMLFVTAFVLLVAVLLEQRTARSLKACLLLLPVLALGIVANNRRLAWVEIALVLATIYFLAPRSRLKRALTAGALVLAPLAALYLAVGWSSSARFFGPVAKVRSIIEPYNDVSAQARDIENYNLIRNLQANPVLGLGFGHEYQQYVPNVDLSAVFPQWRFIPHNSVLGLLAFGGLAGFTLLWAFLTIGVHLAGRAYWLSGDPTLRAAALTVIGAIFTYLLQCYGDMGLVGWQGVFLVAPALAVAGKVALASGAWAASRRPHPGQRLPAAWRRLDAGRSP